MIELRGVSKQFGSKVALGLTTLSFAQGKTTALIGPSGCGKSTMLRLLMGLISPSTGEVVFGGKPVMDWLSVRRKIGYVVQDGGLFPHLNASRNVTLLARHLRVSPQRIASKIADLTALTCFPEDGLDRYPGELSGGQRQRLSLMRALMLDPEVLLLDEPLAALDPMVRSQLQTDLKEIFQRLNQTVIFVTHDMAEAGYLADEIMVMNEGQVVQRGSLQEIRERPASAFVAAFMNAQRSLVTL